MDVKRCYEESIAGIISAADNSNKWGISFNYDYEDVMQWNKLQIITENNEIFSMNTTNAKQSKAEDALVETSDTTCVRNSNIADHEININYENTKTQK